MLLVGIIGGWIAVNILMTTALGVAIIRMKRLDNLIRLNLEAQNSLEELLIKLLRNGRAEDVNESKE
ncbi:hypothetical protein SELR_12840 [Selenomonas ruminantium subsp. lactilytica TAM6421]|uniref:Uncharacterized protein n=1 Tax=Selenomonas ruminantium subsp. lactilytica (strain NBRC 103574 / TAM6421) TaxID=927704 RepID=I0GQF5_SELRL|nr:hypothetical protein SELR_12840 [Selenomonas ruminantium subsp. lactilytica TAM6421]